MLYHAKRSGSFILEQKRPPKSNSLRKLISMSIRKRFESDIVVGLINSTVDFLCYGLY